MKLQKMWPTTIATIEGAIDESTTKTLISVSKNVKADRDRWIATGAHGKLKYFSLLDRQSDDIAIAMFRHNFPALTRYNLLNIKFSDGREQEAVDRFSSVVDGAVKDYLKQTFDVTPDMVRIEMDAFVNVQKRGDRTTPHYHPKADLVVVHYLDVGNPTRSDSGDLLLLDPRPVVAFPFWEKVMTVRPKSGMTIIMPGYVWHESGTYSDNGDRICIVANVAVSSNIVLERKVTHNPQPLPETVFQPSGKANAI